MTAFKPVIGSLAAPDPGPPMAGDLMVTRIAKHYHVGRVLPAGGKLLGIEVTGQKGPALARACRAATGSQRVFLCDRGGPPLYVPVDCANLPPDDD